MKINFVKQNYLLFLKQEEKKKNELYISSSEKKWK